MSRRNITELHHLQLSLFISQMNVNLVSNEQLSVTAKVGKLITSKSNTLQKIKEQYLCYSPLLLDLLVPYDKQTTRYESKEIRIILTHGNKKQKTIGGIATIDLSQHINTNANTNTNTKRYRLYECADKYASFNLNIEYKLLELRNSYSSNSLQLQRSSSQILQTDPLSTSVNVLSQEVLQQSIVLDKSLPYQKQLQIQNIQNQKQNIPSDHSDLTARLQQLCKQPQSSLTFQDTHILHNLSVISHQCQILKSLMNESYPVQQLISQVNYLKQTKQHMRSQMQSLQYLNKILLEQQSTKDKQIEYLQTELNKAYNIINKFKNNIQIETIDDMRGELEWIKQEKELREEELIKMKLLNQQLVKQNQTYRKQKLLREESSIGHQGIKGRKKELILIQPSLEKRIKVSFEMNKVKRELFKEQKKDRIEIIKLIQPLQLAVEQLEESL